jgi:hypothetical protein
MPSWNHQLSPSNKDGSKPVSLLRKGFSSIGAPGLVELEGRSLIAPNTSFARAVVLSDNAPSTRRPIDTTTTSRQHQQQRPVPPILRVDKQVEQRPASNLTLLLSQPERFEPLRDATQDKKTQKSTTPESSTNTSHCDLQEADSASGPAPSTKMWLGSSAPDILDCSEATVVGLGTVSVLAPPGNLNAEDRVRR